MNKPKLTLTTRFQLAVEERIAKEYQALRPAVYSTLGLEDLLALAMEADAMLVTPFDRLDAAFFRKFSASVKVIATYSAGVDPLDIPAAQARSIVTGSTPGANASATAEIAMLLMWRGHASCLWGTGNSAIRQLEEQFCSDLGLASGL